MTPDRDTRTAPTPPRRDADPETLAGLVSSSRRMGLFWPVLAEAPAPRPRRAARPAFAVPPRAASVVAGMAEYAD
ncbi:hypothetical protein LO771_04585 [Streptacidiphilus sp. ASG 303]|uniref:hypothetical protein n=1 Tax=Streptacidiphilus sp. ASG 303 TaxID=2896847 RepID=UPI001E4E5837|nr:hypothetical protein [Streptacidiphilus sp. ASG 303]MCD0481707.1 hypothetical protein [Streptacidiphilus sp. ASG 303]